MTERSGVKIGVVLPRPHDDPGEWLTDAVAFEAAGADALWVEHGAAPVLDPLTLTAALAAVTYRALLVVADVPHPDEPGERRSHVLATVERLSRGRIVLIAEDVADPSGAALEEGAGGTAGVRTFARMADGGYGEGEGRAEGGGEGGGRWVPVAVPGGRAAWREVLREAAGRGDRGVLVPAHPRLLDLLRNPEDPGGRHDLQLAQG